MRTAILGTGGVGGYFGGRLAAAALPAGAKSSMLEDLERGRPLELPF